MARPLTTTTTTAHSLAKSKQSKLQSEECLRGSQALSAGRGVARRRARSSWICTAAVALLIRCPGEDP